MSSFEASIRRLREDFDAQFAKAPPLPEAREELRAIRVAREPYALLMGEVGRLARCRAVTPLPGAPPAFVGLVEIRGEVLPLWGLAGLLGYPLPWPPPRWLACCRAAPAWAAAFDGYEGHLRAPLHELKPFAGGGRAAGLAGSLCTSGGLIRPVLSLERLQQSIRTKEIR
jgi:purine-binding chemotaxis protein CheW